MSALEAVVFDVDGTLVDSERDGHRVAFNLAFEEFGLPYRWGVEEYGRLLRTTGGQRRIDGYLADQGVPEDERGRLAPALHRRKTALMSALVEEGKVGVRPGVKRLLGELADAGCRLGVATTGSRGWVERLLERLLPGVAFEVVVCGDEVDERKPHPEAFVLAVERLKLPAGAVAAVEDSAEGLGAAAGAGLATAVVVNGYTADHDLSRAGLVLDGFGEADRPARVLADRAGTGCGGVLDVATLDRLVAAGPG
ncbi:MAG TPA: HAD-IA family hydrolase [Acidimicrobiales bacterium]|nr:HAD-IA family hydrolase [Acidimicrobiales bacterium]